MKYDSTLTVSFCYITDAFQKDYFNGFLSLLPEEKQLRIRRFRRWQDAQASVLGNCMLAKNIFQGEFQKLSQIKYNSFGKPWIENQKFFNLSHSGDLVVCSYFDHEIGIDVELIKDIYIDDYRDQMTISEWERVTGEIGDLSEFFKYWTEKEAVVKAIGMGLSVPLDSFEIKAKGTFINNRFLNVREILIDEKYVCNIASEASIEDVPLYLEHFNPELL